VNPPVPPFETSGLLTYNVFSDWDRPVIAGDVNPPLPPSTVVPESTKGPRGVPSPLIGSWAYVYSIFTLLWLPLVRWNHYVVAAFVCDCFLKLL
jgi:hypothetical protein